MRRNTNHDVEDDVEPDGAHDQKCDSYGLAAFSEEYDDKGLDRNGLKIRCE
jgi:hypothetical protein